MPIDFEKELNPAQLEAVRHDTGPLLVVAGAGSGKTRTIVYRLAWLVEHGVPAEDILLLTFTRKAAQEMLKRAEEILKQPLAGASGGTFHSFAYSVLRRNPVGLGMAGGFSLLDRGDSEDLVGRIKTDLGLGKGERSFPKKSTLTDLITKSRNKELAIAQVLEQEAFHLTPFAGDIETLAREYGRFKKEHALLDYDDLLFGLEALLASDQALRRVLRARHGYLMVDEYQDTNLVQARIVRLLAGEAGNVMAVGDDAQSIYAFRGANVANIMNFPKIFKDARVITLERNYRSTQPILDVTNAILSGARDKFEKRLYTKRSGGEKPRLVTPLSDQSQARLALERIIELARRYPLHEIAVLFRAGYQSYPLEVALTRLGLSYRKYGGARFHEAAHVKDVLAYLRLARNPSDLVAWQRVCAHVKGVGPKTTGRIVRAVLNPDQDYLAKARKKHPDLTELLAELDLLRRTNPSPARAVERINAFYAPKMAERYPDDHPKRQAGLDQLAQIAAAYSDLETFLADLCLDPDTQAEPHRSDCLVLSTVHSAKGLEWKAVLVIDLVEERFPSKKAMSRDEDLEEERRLLYVACTRAKESLSLFSPATVFSRFSGFSETVAPCPFLLDLPPGSVERWQESYAGGVSPAGGAADRDRDPDQGSRPGPVDPARLGYCRHKIFGQGKIVAKVPPNKFRVNFPGFGLKVIVGDYLEML
ncbi:MAG: ATP-dependent helicase [Desulfovibrionaceae bacterium]|nr:ATP-dependent helicase [Desulfovibrionaceae bacterium]